MVLPVCAAAGSLTAHGLFMTDIFYLREMVIFFM